jgi:hypothetical protein
MNDTVEHLGDVVTDTAVMSSADLCVSDQRICANSSFAIEFW